MLNPEYLPLYKAIFPIFFLIIILSIIGSSGSFWSWMIEKKKVRKKRR
jgi:hypothetical protein